MVRSVTTFDPEWTDEDVDAALAWVDDEALRCAGCGHHRDESMAEGMDQAYESTGRVCHACADRDRTRAAWAEKKGDTAGLYWATRKREGGE